MKTARELALEYGRTFIYRLAVPRSHLMVVAQSQAYFAKSPQRLGYLNNHADFFEYDRTSTNPNLRAVMFDFKDGLDHFKLLLDNINDANNTLWVTSVLNASSVNFLEEPAPTKVTALVQAVVGSAQSLTHSPLLVMDVDYRNLRGDDGADDNAVQTLLVFVSVATSARPSEAVALVARLRGANLFCGNETCSLMQPTTAGRDVCRLCHGLYVCGNECNMCATVDNKHGNICHAIRATHRAWLFNRRLDGDAPQYVLPWQEEEGEEEGEGEGEEEEQLPAAAAAAAAEEQHMMQPPGSLSDMSTDDDTVDEVVEDTQPTGDVDVETIKETPLPAAAAAAAEEEEEKVAPATSSPGGSKKTATRELFPALG